MIGHLTVNQRVPGSSPGAGATIFGAVADSLPHICHRYRRVTHITPPSALNPCRIRADRHCHRMIDTLLDAGDLAERWGVTRATALAYTRRRGFPPPIGLSTKTLRWRSEQVHEWEQTRQREPVRRVTKKHQRAAKTTVQPIVRKVGAR